MSTNQTKFKVDHKVKVVRIVKLILLIAARLACPRIDDYNDHDTSRKGKRKSIPVLMYRAPTRYRECS